MLPHAQGRFLPVGRRDAVLWGQPDDWREIICDRTSQLCNRFPFQDSISSSGPFLPMREQVAAQEPGRLGFAWVRRTALLSLSTLAPGASLSPPWKRPTVPPQSPTLALASPGVLHGRAARSTGTHTTSACPAPTPRVPCPSCGRSPRRGQPLGASGCVSRLRPIPPANLPFCPQNAQNWLLLTPALLLTTCSRDCHRDLCPPSLRLLPRFTLSPMWHLAWLWEHVRACHQCAGGGGWGAPLTQKGTQSPYKPLRDLTPAAKLHTPEHSSGCSSSECAGIVLLLFPPPSGGREGQGVGSLATCRGPEQWSHAAGVCKQITVSNVRLCLLSFSKA
ncbi:uncharacterized protein LOC128311331 [Acinonyx jubatus]|uniref:Uncharacterized protein LOC128311331 n=1 Tax=Acinonyx jubatus TaxID=32536 RepID=A0ABM3NCZ5_ACIJB|nr:uncharacterized protein LOC128311331 [Acinonyx jubatus]XP_053057297.1 uncharacterized protein LOC128311331 [Acinonyx jubatus]